jgi:hypothetical protein
MAHLGQNSKENGCHDLSYNGKNKDKKLNIFL